MRRVTYVILSFCVICLLSGGLFFHTLQTIAPAHGNPAHEIWEEAWAVTGVMSSDRSMQDLVSSEGYPLEEHYVSTADGFVLSVFRIPHGRNGRRKDRQPPVLLQHALLDCSASWVNNGPQESLGFILADAGYDVWLGNSRGNTYSRNHSFHDVHSAAFWAFSWDEMATYDLPATVDYILQHSHGSQLAYVGHSQGTTVAFAALSLDDSLQQKVSVAVMLAPAVFLRSISSQAVLALAHFETDQLFALLGAREFLPSREMSSWIFKEICTARPDLCANVIAAICGYNPHNINQTRLPLYLAYTPAGTSVQNMIHWAQGVRRTTLDFQKFDYGSRCWTTFGWPRPCNLRQYGQPSPPTYPLGNIRTPISLISGGLDRLSDAQDIQVLLNRLADNVVVHFFEEPSYEHLDFTWGVNANDLIYPHILTLLQKYALNDTS